MTLRRGPAKCGMRIFLADKSQEVEENTAAKLAEAKVTARAGGAQAASLEAGKVWAEGAQDDLDAVARMASEGGPHC